MALYTFDTTIAPDSVFWDDIITSVTSDGSRWVFASGGSGYKKLTTTPKYDIKDGGIELYVDLQFPGTTNGYNGVAFSNNQSGGNFRFLEVAYTWENYYSYPYVRVRTHNGFVYTSNITSNTRFNTNIKINKDGTAEVKINGTTVWSGSGFIDTFKYLTEIRKYTESAGYVYGGYFSQGAGFNPHFSRRKLL